MREKVARRKGSMGRYPFMIYMSTADLKYLYITMSNLKDMRIV